MGGTWYLASTQLVLTVTIFKTFIPRSSGGQWWQTQTLELGEWAGDTWIWICSLPFTSCVALKRSRAGPLWVWSIICIIKGPIQKDPCELGNINSVVVRLLLPLPVLGLMAGVVRGWQGGPRGVDCCSKAQPLSKGSRTDAAWKRTQGNSS